MAKWPNCQMAKFGSDPGVIVAKGRLKTEFLVRTESFSDRCIAVAEQLEQDRRFRRLVEQLAASGSAVGANLAEANEAMSTKDFRKSLAIVVKELAETRFWLRLVVRRGWLPSARLDPLLSELAEIKLVVGSILSKTKSSVGTRRSDRPVARKGIQLS
jgi:four helix bundle protein